MTITAPPRPPRPGDRIDRNELEALIEEARRRARRRRRISGAVAAIAGIVAFAVFTVVDRAAPSQSASAGGTPVDLSAGTANSKIAFLRDPDGDGAFGGDIELLVMNPDGSGQLRLTRKASDSFAPAWSPDAGRIAFVRHRRGAPLPRGGRAEHSDIWVVSADGSGERRLTSGPRGGDGSPAWSPDGRKIAFIRNVLLPLGAGSSDLYVMNTDGSGQRRLTRGLSVIWYSPAWSPDGRQIAFIGTSGKIGDAHAHIYVVNADGSGERQLTQSPGNYLLPAWSPDGREIAFSGDGAIYVMNADGTGERKLVPEWVGHWSSPSWSPDGRKIAFHRHSAVYVMNADGTGQRKLASGDSPVWSPDSRQILFGRFVGHVSAEVRAHGGDAEGNVEIFVANVDGGGQRRLTRNPGDDVGAAWSAQHKK